MTNTPHNRHAFENIARLASALNTGFEIKCRVTDNEAYAVLDILKPRDTDRIAYPTVYFLDAFVDEDGIAFEIVPGIYADHSLAQTQRVVNGLCVAMKLIEVLYATARAFGIPTAHTPA